MGASNRRGLLDAKLELLLGCALPPRHAEGASSSLRQALSAAPRDKLLAYALHFAQQYGTAGEAGTGVALLEEYTRAYTQQYGLKAVDRRLVTLRPQLLEAHLESLSREARPPPRPHPEDLADPLPEPTERLEQQCTRLCVLCPRVHFEIRTAAAARHRRPLLAEPTSTSSAAVFRPSIFGPMRRIT